MIWGIIFLLTFFSHPSLIVHPEGWEGSERVADHLAIIKDATEETVLTSEEFPGGSHNYQFDNQTLVVAGGYFRACYANAVRDIFINSENCIVIIPMTAVYQGATRTLYEHYQENFSDKESFMDYLEQVARFQFCLDNPVIVVQGTFVVVYDGGILEK